MGNPTVTRAMMDRLEMMHQQGHTWPEIARTLGVTVDTAKYHGKKLGLTREQKRVTDRVRREIFRLRDKGVSKAAIARQLEFHVTTVNEALRSSGSRYQFRDEMRRDPVNQLLMRAWA